MAESKQKRKTLSEEHSNAVEPESSDALKTNEIPAEMVDEKSSEAIQEPQVMSISIQDYESLKQKVAEYSDGWQRERADFANYKKRIEREQATAQQNITANIVKKYLVVLDDLERALKARPSQGDGSAWAEGVDLIYRKLQSILEAEGVTRIKVEGEYFNPSIHEAIMQEENPNFESGQIIEVIQQGYMLGDRVIRPAQVRVAR
jgi:molecular chaperone GrpE